MRNFSKLYEHELLFTPLALSQLQLRSQTFFWPKSIVYAIANFHAVFN